MTRELPVTLVDASGVLEMFVPIVLVSEDLPTSFTLVSFAVCKSFFHVMV